MSRWIVRNAVLTSESGNGIWSRHRTYLGALWTRHQILRFRFRTGFYAVPAGGLIVMRTASERSR